MIKISSNIQEKLNKRCIDMKEIAQCFANRTGKFFEDTRWNHATNPPTWWFIAETDKERILKVVFVGHKDNSMEIKSAYEPNQTVIDLYDRLNKR